MNPIPPPQNPEKPQDQIKSLCGFLAESMDRHITDRTVLDEQVQILNALFNATLAEQLDLTPKRHEYNEARQQGWLKLALKIQKQCMDTLRTQKTMEYMDNLARPAPAPLAVETLLPFSTMQATKKAAPQRGDHDND